MRSIEHYIEWFRDKSNLLDPKIKDEILFAINQDYPRAIYIDLDNIIKKFDLSEEWRNKIQDYYDWVF